MSETSRPPLRFTAVHADVDPREIHFPRRMGSSCCCHFFWGACFCRCDGGSERFTNLVASRLGDVRDLGLVDDLGDQLTGGAAELRRYGTKRFYVTVREPEEERDAGLPGDGGWSRHEPISYQIRMHMATGLHMRYEHV